MSYVTTPMIFYISNIINEIWRKTKVGIFVSLDMFCKLYYICPWFMNFNFHWSDWICIFIDEIESSDFIEGVRSGIRPYFTCQIPRFQIIRQIQLKYILNLKNMLLKSTLLKCTLLKNTFFRNTLLKNTLLKIHFFRNTNSDVSQQEFRISDESNWNISGTRRDQTNLVPGAM